MSGPLALEQQRALLGFLGFGNPRAGVVFLGMEEGLTVPPALGAQLALRATFPPIVDMGAAAAAQPTKYLSGPRPQIQPTWNVIVRVLLALEGRTEVSSDDLRFYQRDRLGRASEDAALLELLPLPAPSTKAWPYAAFFPQYPTREAYARDLLAARTRALRAHLAYGPRLLIAYGAASWDSYREIVPSARIWQRHGPFEVADAGPTRAILAPHMTARAMNGHRGDLIALACEWCEGRTKRSEALHAATA